MAHFAQDIVGLDIKAPSFDFEKYVKKAQDKSHSKKKNLNASDSKNSNDEDRDNELQDDTDSSSDFEAIHISLEWRQDTILSQIDLIHPAMIHNNVNEARMRLITELISNIDKEYEIPPSLTQSGQSNINVQQEKEAIKKILEAELQSLKLKLHVATVDRVLTNQPEKNINTNKNNVVKNDNSDNTAMNEQYQQLSDRNRNRGNKSNINCTALMQDAMSTNNEWLCNMIKLCHKPDCMNKNLHKFASEIFSQMLHPKYIDTSLFDNINNGKNKNNININKDKNYVDDEKFKDINNACQLNDVRLLFLDVDGVLNGENLNVNATSEIQQTRAPNYVVEYFPTEAHMNRLKTILDSYDNLKIVVSSSWRCKVNSLYELFVAMDLIGIDVFDRVIGVTPQFTEDTFISMSLRELEIETWLFACVSNFEHKNQIDINTHHTNINATKQEKDNIWNSSDKNENENANDEMESKKDDVKEVNPFKGLKQKFGAKMKQIVQHYEKEFGNRVQASKFVILDDRKFDETQMIVKGRTYVQTNVVTGINDKDVQLTIALLK